MTDQGKIEINVEDLRDALEFLEYSNSSGRKAHAFKMAIGRATESDWPPTEPE